MLLLSVCLETIISLISPIKKPIEMTRPMKKSIEMIWSMKNHRDSSAYEVANKKKSVAVIQLMMWPTIKKPIEII